MWVVILAITLAEKIKSVITLNGSDQPNSGFVKSDYKEVYNNIDAGVRLVQVYRYM